jgi:hypothetical protein
MAVSDGMDRDHRIRYNIVIKLIETVPIQARRIASHMMYISGFPIIQSRSTTDDMDNFHGIPTDNQVLRRSPLIEVEIF